MELDHRVTEFLKDTKGLFICKYGKFYKTDFQVIISEKPSILI